MKQKSSFLQQLAQELWSFFLSGLLTILPLALTVALFHFALRLVKGWFQPLHRLLATTCVGLFPHIEIIAVFVVIILIGILMQLFILRSVVAMLEKIIFRIPLVRPVYSGIKQLINAFNPHDKQSFKKVVLVQFPRVGSYSIGFITSAVPPEFSPDITKQYFHVFIPHTPNPTSGYVMLVVQEEIIAVDVTRQEAMALIISGGIIMPDRFNQV